MLLYSHPLSGSIFQESSYRNHRSDHQHSLPQGDRGPPPQNRDRLGSSSPGGHAEDGSSSDTWRCSGDPRGRRRGGTSCSPARRGGGRCWHTCEACRAPAMQVDFLTTAPSIVILSVVYLCTSVVWSNANENILSSIVMSKWISSVNLYTMKNGWFWKLIFLPVLLHI